MVVGSNTELLSGVHMEFHILPRKAAPHSSQWLVRCIYIQGDSVKCAIQIMKNGSKSNIQCNS